MEDNDQNTTPSNIKPVVNSAPPEIQPIISQQTQTDNPVVSQNNIIGQVNTPQKSSKSPKRLIIISMIGVVLIIGTALGYKPVMERLFGIQPKSISELQPELNNQKKPITTDLSDTATRFGSMTNASITFPKDWDVVVKPPSSSVEISQASAEGPLFEGQTSIISSSIAVKEDENNLFTDRSIEALLESEKPDIEKESMISQEKTTIAGLPAIIITYKNEDTLGQKTGDSPSHKIVKWILIDNNDTFFTINMISDEKINQNIEPLYNKVISSFSL